MGLSDGGMKEGRSRILAETVTGFVRAKPEDAACLRRLAYASEAYWGYEKAFMEKFDRTFNVTEPFIQEHPVYVFWEGANPAAFWGLRQEAADWELEYFYVSVRGIGKGYGKRMWNHMTDWCKSRGVKKIHFVASHQAVGFYEKMGAVQNGATLSAIDQRVIPHFMYELNEND